MWAPFGTQVCNRFGKISMPAFMPDHLGRISQQSTAHSSAHLRNGTAKQGKRVLDGTVYVLPYAVSTVS